MTTARDRYGLPLIASFRIGPSARTSEPGTGAVGSFAVPSTLGSIVSGSSARVLPSMDVAGAMIQSGPSVAQLVKQHTPAAPMSNTPERNVVRCFRTAKSARLQARGRLRRP